MIEFYIHVDCFNNILFLHAVDSKIRWCIQAQHAFLWVIWVLQVHGVDVEGMQLGIDDALVELLGRWSPIPVTYAGGARTLVRHGSAPAGSCNTSTC